MKRVIDIPESALKAISHIKFLIGGKEDRLLQQTVISSLTKSESLNAIMKNIRSEIENRSYGVANDSVIWGEMHERRAVLEIIDKYIENEIELEFVKNKKDKSKECGNCEFFSTSGWEAPSGKCSKHPEFNKDVCMAYSCFPDYATVCDDFVERYPEHKEMDENVLEFKNGNYIKYGRNL